MCYGITSSDTMRPAIKVFTRRGDGRLFTPGYGPAKVEEIKMDKWILSPTPHGWHVHGNLNDIKNRDIEEWQTARVVWVAKRAAYCAHGWALIYVPSNPLAAPPKPPTRRVPSLWNKIKSACYGSRQVSILTSVLETGYWVSTLPNNCMYRMNQLDSIKRVVSDMGWNLTYDKWPRRVRVTA